MSGRTPATTGRRRRSRGWSSPSKASSRRRQPPDPSSASPTSQQPSMPQGTEVEVRVDDDGFHGSWFEATVEGFLPARGRRSARYTVTYTHLLSDDSGSTLVEPFDPSHIRPRPPPPASSAKALRLHEMVEAFHNDGWWSGIVLATDPLTVAFPITREVIAFPPNLVRPRRDYVDGQWVPAQAVIAVQPKRAVRVYVVGDKVEVVRDREVYGYSWFPATVVKVIDRLSYLVEYFDLDVTEGGEKAIEYLHCLFIRPAVEHSPRESEFRLGPGAAVEAYCDGAWSPGVVIRAVVDGEYEVSIDGKETEQLLNKVPELLKPQYKWDGKHWRIASPKRQGNRRRSVSGKLPSSPVEVASSDDERRHDVGSSATKRLRKELPQKEPKIALTKGSEHPPESEMDTTLSALRKSLASNHSPKSRSPLSGKNNFQVMSRRIVSTCAGQIKRLGLLHASSEHPILQNESITDGTGEVVNQEILSDMMFSDGQLSTPVCGPSANEASLMVLTAGLRNKEMDSSCVNNAAQQTQQRPLSVQALQLKNCTYKHKGGELHSIQALQGKSIASDKVQIQLEGNNSISRKEIVHALSSPTCNTRSALDKQIKVSDVVSGGTGIGSNTKVLTSKKSAKLGFKDFSSPHSSMDATCTVQKRGRKRVAGRLKESSVERQLERRGPHSQQPLNVNLDDIMYTNEGADHELLPLIPPGFESICNGKGFLDEGEVDEGPTQQHFWNAGSSQCTADSTLLRSCSVACSSLPSTLHSRISAEEDLFIKTSPMWHQIEAMEQFQDVPQRPHFLPLKQFVPVLREGMALGLMVTYASLVQSVKVSRIADSMESFEQKITALDHLEKNGFNIKFLQHSLNKLLQTKYDHTKHLKHLDKLKELLPGKESVVSQKYSLLDEKEKTIVELERKLESLRGEAEQIARETNAEDAELSRLKADVCNSQEECGDDELRFHNILVELRSRPRLCD